jgi:hypothetical protein
MEYLGKESFTVKDFLYQMKSFDHPSKYLRSVSLPYIECFCIVLDQLVDKIAHAIATMHSGDSIHGDLTTSNMMLKPRIPLEWQLSGQDSLSVQDLVRRGDIGEFVSDLTFFSI